MSSPYPGSGPNGPNGGGVPPQNGQSWGPPQQGAPQQNAPQQTPGYTGAPPQYPGSPTGAPGGPGGYGAPPQKKKPWPWIVAGCGCLAGGAAQGVHGVLHDAGHRRDGAGFVGLGDEHRQHELGRG